MLRPRIIPCLLIHRGGLVKTTRFANPKYIGDPLNAVRIFNEKQVDELIVLDIDATTEGREPNYELIARLAVECRMPLCYGGGVSDAKQVERIVGLGVEKVAIGHAALIRPQLIAEASQSVGGQSMVVVLDVCRTGIIRKEYRLYSQRGRLQHQISIDDYLQQIQDLGSGEVLVNAVDRDGTLEGYDIELIDRVAGLVRTPLTVLGGAASLQDMRNLFLRYGSIGIAAGSLFVFKGPYRAVLIQYPEASAKDTLFSNRPPQ
jgi:cyclase